MKSKAQQVVDNLRTLYGTFPGGNDPYVTKLLNAIEQDTRDAEKHVWHGPYVTVYAWTPPDQTGQFELKFQGADRYYVVEEGDMSKNPEKIDTSEKHGDGIDRFTDEEMNEYFFSPITPRDWPAKCLAMFGQMRDERDKLKKEVEMFRDMERDRWFKASSVFGPKMEKL